MQVVSQLELQLAKEKDRLAAMMQHLHMNKQNNSNSNSINNSNNNTVSNSRRSESPRNPHGINENVSMPIIIAFLTFPSSLSSFKVEKLIKNQIFNHIL